MTLPEIPAAGPLPIVPVELLKHYAVHERDTRLKSCARLLAAIWLRRQDIPTGHHRGRDGRARRLGSRLSPAAAQAGRNFLTPTIAQLAHQVIAYREHGALYPADQILGNALSSASLCINMMAPLVMNRDLAARALRQLLPTLGIERVTGIRFEHSPYRSPSSRLDQTAFDCVCWYVGTAGPGVIAIETKYTEGLHDSAPCEPGRYDHLAESSGLFKAPYHAALRVNPLQQLFREHLLAQAAVMRGDWPAATTFVSMGPAVHERLKRQADLYRSFLNPPVEGQVPFVHLTLDAFVAALAAAGDPGLAQMLFERYLDWGQVDRLVAEALSKRVAKWPARSHTRIHKPVIGMQAAGAAR